MIIIFDYKLLPFLIGYVNSNYEDINDQRVFAYDEPHATRIVLETYTDTKFVFGSMATSENIIQEAV